jgi:D-alanyl-D-alanine-carboxypeptidase/D-alanyl-D-alanine-endopeptidase
LIKKWLVSVAYVIGGVLALFLMLLAFNYYRIDNRVVLEPIAEFENRQAIVRLDSVLIQPDSIALLVNALMQRAHVHGLAISVVNNHQLVYQQYFGWKNKKRNEPFTRGTMMYGASLSKTIFADIVLQLVEENVLTLDTPLYRYLRHPLPDYTTNFFQQLSGDHFIDYTDLKGDDRYKNITARMCLSHASGLPNWRWLEPDKKLTIKFDPGTKYSYSGEGMFLLQMVIEELTGKGFETLAVEKIFEPLDMQRSSYVWQRAYEGNYAGGHDGNANDLNIPKRHVPNAAGSLSTTLEDYTHYFTQVLQQKQPRYARLIAPQIQIKSLQQFGPNALIDTGENDDIHLAYGLGFGVYDTPFGKAFFKEGHLEGWQHYAVGFPEKGTALIVMSNSENAESIFKPLIEALTGNTYTPWFWEGYIPYDSNM